MPSVEFYKKALRIRMIEEAIAKEYPKGEMRCPVHLSIGQEVNAVAIASCLTRQDYMVSTHRGHAHYLAKGGSLDGLLGELYGKAIGCARGNGGSMHTVDHSCGFLGSTSIVGGTIPVGVGSAFASHLRKDARITAVCFGDAAVEQGVFHEAANFASLHRLPVIFFMENNRYSCFTPLENRQPDRADGFKSVADGHGMGYFRIRWESFDADVTALQDTVKTLRHNNEYFPLFVECDAYRFVEHCGPASDDHLNYRPKEEVEKYSALDPMWKYISPLSLYRDEITYEIKSSFDRVKKSPAPWVEELGKYLHA